MGSLHAKNVPVIINISVQPEASVGQITVCRMREPEKETFRKKSFHRDEPVTQTGLRE